MAFFSDASNLDPAHTNAFMDVFVKDLVTGDLTLVSPSTREPRETATAQVFTSADGTRVAFLSTATNLDPGDTDTCWDVYLKNLVTGEIILASTSDGGQGKQRQLLPVAVGRRHPVVFPLALTNLDPVDTDFIHDVYVKDLTETPRCRRPDDADRPRCHLGVA